MQCWYNLDDLRNTRYKQLIHFNTSYEHDANYLQYKDRGHDQEGFS